LVDTLHLPETMLQNLEKLHAVYPRNDRGHVQKAPWQKRARNSIFVVERSPDANRTRSR